jgi:hypothetical protein
MNSVRTVAEEDYPLAEKVKGHCGVVYPDSCQARSVSNRTTIGLPGILGPDLPGIT